MGGTIGNGKGHGGSGCGFMPKDKCKRAGDSISMPLHIAREVSHLLKSKELDGKGEYFAELILNALKRNG